ncbi:MAG: heparinase II/III family protein [Clostridia bacterium]|nr:heparinase II/III family protein [Clostridia bacterium]
MFTEYLDTHDLSTLLGAPGTYRPFPPRKDRAAWEGLSEAKRSELIEWGNEALEGYPMLTATQFMAYQRTGERPVFEKPYFDRRKLLMGATFAECVLNDDTYLDAIIDGLWAICEESTWVVSAHNDGQHEQKHPSTQHCLPDVKNPYVDLFAAQTASTLAFVLYFMEDKLDAVTPRIAQRVRDEINARVLTPFEQHDDFWWMGMIRKDMNNWNPWILSNMIYTILLLEQNPRRRCDLLARSMRMLDSYLAVMPKDGGCDEGAGYFNVAGASLLDCLEAICDATDGKVSFYHEEHIRNIGTYPLKSHIAGPYYLNFADCDCKPTINDMPIVRYGLRTENPALAALGASIHELNGGIIRVQDTPQMNRRLYGIFDRIPELDALVEPAFMQMPNLQVFAWRKGSIYAAIKGGCNGESHNHNDVGTFIVYVDGQPQVVDMGNMLYTAKTFGPERYTLPNTRSGNHNLPLIGDVEQQEGVQYRAEVICADEEGAELELAGAYPKEACAKSIRRTFMPKETGAVLHDVITLSEANEVTWVFLLREKPEGGEGEIRFGSLTLKYDPQLSQSVTEMPTTDVRLEKNFPGSLWRLALKAKKNDSFDQHFVITRS